MGLKGGLNTYAYAGLSPLNMLDADGRCYQVVLPNGTDFGRDDFRTGAWSKWSLLYPIIQGPEEGRGAAPGVPFSTYECVCARTRKVDWSYYWRSRVRIVEICLTCSHPHISERDDFGSKNYYRTQSLDFDQRKIPGGISAQSEPVMELDCEHKCDALNHQ